MMFPSKDPNRHQISCLLLVETSINVEVTCVCPLWQLLSSTLQAVSDLNSVIYDWHTYSQQPDAFTVYCARTGFSTLMVRNRACNGQQIRRFRGSLNSSTICKVNVDVSCCYFNNPLKVDLQNPFRNLIESYERLEVGSSHLFSPATRQRQQLIYFTARFNLPRVIGGC